MGSVPAQKVTGEIVYVQLPFEGKKLKKGKKFAQVESGKWLGKVFAPVNGELVEMSHNRENCLCYGGGGNLEMMDSKLSGEIAKAKIDEVTATGANVVVTACQQCVRTMNTHVRRNKLSLEVMDIVQLVQKALSN
jgi:Fe-S oxidoreductase